ncbi:MAG TPA: hypothetical protein VFL79_02190 [Terriglobia bacterium]|nr:hypothetical protein [Terriglobia bacterium]
MEKQLLLLEWFILGFDESRRLLQAVQSGRIVQQVKDARHLPGRWAPLKATEHHQEKGVDIRVQGCRSGNSMRSGFQSEIRIEDLRDLNNRSNGWTHALPLLGAAFCLLIYYAAIILEDMLSFTPCPGLHCRTSEIALTVSLLAVPVG